MARRPRDIEDDEPAPWAEPAARARAVPADEPRHTVISWRTLIIGGVVALVLAIGLVIGVRTMLNRDAATAESGEAGLVRAPAEPYKTRPGNPGGLALEGSGDTIFETGNGAELDGQLDPSALPEEPARPAPRDLLPADGSAEDGEAALIGSPTAPAATPPSPPAAATPVLPPSAPPKARETAIPPDKKPPLRAAPAPTSPTAVVNAALAPEKPVVSMGSVQLGAFSTRERATQTWTRLAGRFPELGGLSRSIAEVERDGATLYRLRGAGAANPAEICAKLKSAGETCIVAR